MGETFVVSNTTAKVSLLNKHLKDIYILGYYNVLASFYWNAKVLPRICLEGLYRESFTQQNLPPIRYTALYSDGGRGNI